LFTQAEHVRRKPNLKKSQNRGNRNILEIRISCTQLKTVRIHDSNAHSKSKVSSNLISDSESKVEVNTSVRIWYRGFVLTVV
jgi:hypothetical protein